MQTHWLTRVYLRCLALFPAAYREEYGEELAYAIRASVEEARARGRRALIGLAWRELRDLPPALVAAHVSQWEGRAMRLQAGAHLPGGPMRSSLLVPLFVPFTIPLVMTLFPILLGGHALWLHRVLVVALSLAALAIGVLGLARGFPAWTLPSVGVLLCVIWFPLKWVAQAAILIVLGLVRLSGAAWTGGLSTDLVRSFWPEALWGKVAQQAGLDVAFLAIAVLMAGGLLLLSPSLRRRVGRDWSSLSFLLYGMSIPYAALHDSFRGLEPYEIAGGCLLAGGAALFVLVPRRWQRLLALTAALLLAQSLLSLGTYLVFPAQTFATPDASFRLWETLRPALELPVLLSLVCLPALLALWPAWPGDDTQPSPAG